MRVLNIASALSGALALVMLAFAHHALADDPDGGIVLVGAIAQLAAAGAGLAIANRSGRLNLIAGALIVGGAALFAQAIYLGAFHLYTLHILAPVGGAAMIAGWIMLAFTKPG